MTLGEGISAAEASLGRPLLDDEIMLVKQLVDTGKELPDVIALFDGFERPPDVDEEGVPINRYEPMGAEQARRI